MKRIDKGSVVIALGALLTLLQAALAGVAFVGRQQAERQLQQESDTTSSYAMQLDAARRREREDAAELPKQEILDGADVAGTLQVIQSVGDAAGITVQSAKASQSSTAGRQSFQITGRGRPDQVCAFVAGIERHVRLIVVENGRLLPGTAEEVNFELGLATYHKGGGK